MVNNICLATKKTALFPLIPRLNFFTVLIFHNTVYKQAPSDACPHPHAEKSSIVHIYQQSLTDAPAQTAKMKVDKMTQQRQITRSASYL